MNHGRSANQSKYTFLLTILPFNNQPFLVAYIASKLTYYNKQVHNKVGDCVPGYRRDITDIIKRYDPIGTGTIKMIMEEDLHL